MSAALEAEAIRLYRRYAVEIVEALGFCPYAERARVEGRTRELVISAAEPTDDEVGRAVESIADDLVVEIGLVIFPGLALDARALGRWVERLRKAHAARRGAPLLAIEGFHPDAEPDTTNADRLTPFVRRTPDPTLQLTRLAVLERVRRGTVQGTAFFDPASMDLHALLSEPAPRPLHERIAERNLATVERLGAAEVADAMDDILRDRDATYARLDRSLPVRYRPR